MSKHYGLTEAEARRFTFFAGVTALCMGIIGATLALVAFLVTWPGHTRDPWMIIATYSLLLIGGVLCIFGLATGFMALFIPGPARRMGLAAALINITLFLSIYAYASWPTSNTLTSAAANGEMRTCKFAIRLGVDPTAKPILDRWDPRYGFTDHPDLNAIEAAEEYGHTDVANYLRSVANRAADEQ